MKKQLLSLVILSVGVLSAQDAGIRTLASELPVVPKGVPPSTYPMPRTEWVVNVQNMIREGQKSAESTKLILDGDSITAGFRRFWNIHFSHIPAFNFAMAGDRTQHLLWRLEQGQVENMRPQMVLLMIGRNNQSHNDSAKDIIAGVTEVVNQYRKRCPDAVIYLQSIIPGGSHTGEEQEITRDVNKGIAQLADGRHIVFLDISEIFLLEDGSLNREFLPDTLHPSKEGYAAWAEVLRPIVEKLH